jgi:hypothetical protein
MSTPAPIDAVGNRAAEHAEGQQREPAQRFEDGQIPG